jgi:hypothetical protein
MTARRFLAIAGLFALAAPTARAQNWRTFTAQRALGREDSLRVVVSYGLGKFHLRAAEPAALYSIDMRYDADVFRVEKSYDAASHTLRVGADSATAVRFSLSAKNFRGSSSHGRAESGTMTLYLARGVPLDLTVQLGIATADLDFGELWVDRAKIEAAMGAAAISFPTPNVHPMRELIIDAAFGGLSIDHLGNARARRVKIDAALGGGEIDLRGDWTGEMTVEVSSVLGGFHLSAPTDAGVRINATTRFSGMSVKGFTQRGDAYYSANYDSAKRKVIITAEATLGGYEVGWVAP